MMEVMEVRTLLFLALHLQMLFTIGILTFKRKDMDTETSSSSEVVMVAFKAKLKKKPSHAGIWYALERLLKHGDTLIILSVHKAEKVDMLPHFPGLSDKCTDMGINLLVLSKVDEDLELTTCREAMTQHASHVILDSSLKSKPRLTFYKYNLSCNLTRVRRNGSGLDFIRPIQSSSWVAPKLLSNDELIDEFEFSLGGPPGSDSEHPRSLHRTFESYAHSSSLAYDSDDLFSIDIGRGSAEMGYDSDDLFSIDIGGGSPDRQTEIDVDSFSVKKSLLSGCDEGEDEFVHFTKVVMKVRMSLCILQKQKFLNESFLRI